MHQLSAIQKVIEGNSSLNPDDALSGDPSKAVEFFVQRENRRRASQVSAWLVAPPQIDPPDQLVHLVQDLVAVLHPFEVTTVWTSEPREYRLTPIGMNALRDALVACRVESMIFDSDADDFLAENVATAFIALGSERAIPDLATHVRITATGPTTEERQALLLNLTDFVRYWVVPLNSAAAFVSDDLRDTPDHTHHEETRQLSKLRRWSGVQSHVRGVFWGMYLGAALCDRLGGQARVLAQAPSVITEPLGTGVWLQLSDAPPADRATYAAMVHYLAPLMTWTKEEATPPPMVSSANWGERLPLPPDDTQPVPTQIIERPENHAALNIYVVPPLTEAAADRVIEVVRRWYKEGFDGAYGGEGFHLLSSVSVDFIGAVLRWDVDLGLADPEVSIQALAIWLGSLTDMSIVRLIVGTEVVG